MATSIWLLLDNLRPAGGQPADDEPWMGPLWLALMGLGFLVFGIGAAWPRRQPDAGELDVDAERGWLDLYASHDPVANGGPVPPVLDARQAAAPDLATGGRLRLAPARPHRLLAQPRRVRGHPRRHPGRCRRAVGGPARELGRLLAAVAAARRHWRIGWLRGCGG
jgi:hypothetical protein